MSKNADFQSPLQDGQVSGRAIVEQAQRCLHESGYAALRSVNCEYRNNGVILSGRVPSYYLKQLAQAKVLALPHVASLVNNIDVRG